MRNLNVQINFTAKIPESFFFKIKSFKMLIVKCKRNKDKTGSWLSITSVPHIEQEAFYFHCST